MMTENALRKIPDILLAQLFSFSFIYALTSSLCFTFPALDVFMLVLLFQIIYFIALYNKTTIGISAVIIVTGLIAVLFICSTRPGFDKCRDFIYSYSYWLSGFISSADGINLLYQGITVLALCVSITIFVYILTVKKYYFFILLTAGTAIFVSQWSMNYMTTLVPFYIFLLASLMAYFKYIHARKSKKSANEYLGTGIFTLWTIPVCIIVISMASFLNVNEKPLQWKWLDRQINSIYNYFNKNFDYQAFDYFSLSSSGFGGRDNLLGGRVKLDNTLVLKVQTPRNVYLKGAVCDVYTGTKWIDSSSGTAAAESDFKSIYKDNSEMLKGMMLLTGDSDFLNKYFYKDRISVTFQNLRTKSLFLPSKTFNFIPSGNIKSVIDANGALSSSKRLGKGYSYNVECYSPKLGSEEFMDMLRKSKSGLYRETLNKTLLASSYSITVQADDENGSSSYIRLPTRITANSPDGNITADELDVLASNADEIRSKYLQLPDNLPQRVRDLSASLTASCNNDYDKVKAIEQYLAQNYPYNLDVRPTPKNRDFVDYFLFDLKEGYCSYYASALAVLARCAGIPARYVEGYILPPDSVKDDPTSFLVTNLQAHAWVEVYFEGYGWLPFEATSPFRSTFYSSAENTASISGDHSSAYDDYMEMIERYKMNQNGGFININVQETDKTPGYLITLIVLGFLILFLFIIILFNLIKNKIRLYKIFNMAPRESILRLYNYYVSVLSIQNLGLTGGETPSQYSGRVDTYMYFSPVKFKLITDIFVKCRYSLNEVSEKEKSIICDFQRPFISETKNNMGKFKYFLLKCILGKI